MSIILENVRKEYDGKQVISGFSYVFPDTGRFCLMGPSGCGKTTLLRLIAGLEQPDEGKIERNGSLKFGVQFQEDRLLPWFTVRKNLGLLMDQKKIGESLSAIGLEDESRKYPNELSGGMKRRISLIRALKCPSDVILLDEPVREVDTENAMKMLDLIEHESKGKLLIMVSHDISHARKLDCEIIELRKKEENER